MSLGRIDILGNRIRTAHIVIIGIIYAAINGGIYLPYTLFFIVPILFFEHSMIPGKIAKYIKLYWFIKFSKKRTYIEEFWGNPKLIKGDDYFGIETGWADSDKARKMIILSTNKDYEIHEFDSKEMEKAINQKLWSNASLVEDSI